MKRGCLAVLLSVSLSGCTYGVSGGVVTGQPLPSGSQPAGLDRAGLRTLDDVPALTLFATSDHFLAIFPFRNIPVLWDHPEALAKLLEQAAVLERLAPDGLIGAHTTMGGTHAVVTTDSGGLRVNGTKVVCQQLNITNAAVYIVDDLVAQR